MLQVMITDNSTHVSKLLNLGQARVPPIVLLPVHLEQQGQQDLPLWHQAVCPCTELSQGLQVSHLLPDRHLDTVPELDNIF